MLFKSSEARWPRRASIVQQFRRRARRCSSSRHHRCPWTPGSSSPHGSARPWTPGGWSGWVVMARRGRDQLLHHHHHHVQAPAAVCSLHLIGCWVWLEVLARLFYRVPFDETKQFGFTGREQIGCREHVRHGCFNKCTNTLKKTNKSKLDDEATKRLICLHCFHGSDAKWGCN